MLYLDIIALWRSRTSVGLYQRFAWRSTPQQSYYGLYAVSKKYYASRKFYTGSIHQNQAESEREKMFSVGEMIPDRQSEIRGVKSSAQGVTSPSASELGVAKTIDEATVKRLRKYIKQFFAKYPAFDYDPTKPYTEEFIRMTQQFGWLEDSEEYKTARKRLNSASVRQFNENFDRESKSERKKKEPKSEGRVKKFNGGGKDSEQGAKKKRKMLRKWIMLFNRIDLKDPVMPKTVPEFEERVKSVHTNICDVLDADIVNKKATDWGNEFASFGHPAISTATSMHLVLKIPLQLRITPPLIFRQNFHASFIAKSTVSEQDPSARTHLSSFFAQYPDFEYDTSQPFMEEFWRLIKTKKYGLRGKKYKSARKGIRNAIVQEFQDIYGSHSCNLHAWHKFFRRIGISEEPRDVGLCHERVKSINLNICDLIDRTVTGVVVKDFPSVKELSDYTFENPKKPKIVPRISSEEDPIVGRLFRTFTNPIKLKAKKTVAPSVQNPPTAATRE
ncbi:unnamed protein product [Rhizoctonia solani]|uniref:Uncharacterized protein n=1 Tax=Rhizoctonia solani TaxID=456999 RepID=A0A8H2WJI9_9AGAM|nr:unnamed protein product [Rhizoctonia solani]